jgi:hypothetical protein
MRGVHLIYALLLVLRISGVVLEFDISSSHFLAAKFDETADRSESGRLGDGEIADTLYVRNQLQNWTDLASSGAARVFLVSGGGPGGSPGGGDGTQPRQGALAREVIWLRSFFWFNQDKVRYAISIKTKALDAIKRAFCQLHLSSLHEGARNAIIRIYWLAGVADFTIPNQLKLRHWLKRAELLSASIAEALATQLLDPTQITELTDQFNRMFVAPADCAEGVTSQGTPDASTLTGSGTQHICSGSDPSKTPSAEEGASSITPDPRA